MTCKLTEVRIKAKIDYSFFLMNCYIVRKMRILGSQIKEDWPIFALLKWDQAFNKILCKLYFIKINFRERYFL